MTGFDPRYSVGSPKQFYRKQRRGRNILERANEAAAEKETRFLQWLHPTKGYRRMSHKRMKAGLIYYNLKSGYPFSLYVQEVAKGRVNR